MSALRPLPSAIFAIALRLSEPTAQRKQLVAAFCSTNSVVHGGNADHDLRAWAFTRSRRRVHVLRTGGAQNRFAQLSLQTPAGRHSDVERTRDARRATHLRGLDSRLCLRLGQVFAAAVRGEHGRWVWALDY